MTNIIFIYRISGDVFQEIKYTTIKSLTKKLKNITINYADDILITLLINENILNDNEIFNDSILSKIEDCDFITVIFSQKKDLYCLGNENGKYILDDNKKDKYSKLCKLIILNNKNNSYNIIKNNIYYNIVSLAVKQDGHALKFASSDLQNDKDIVLEAVTQNALSLKHASIDLKNDKEFILECVKYSPNCLIYTNNNLKNDKEIVLECIKHNNKFCLENISDNLRNDKEFILECIKYNKECLEFANDNLRNDKEFILECVKQNGKTLEYASTLLQNNKEVVLVAISQHKDAFQYASSDLRYDKEVVLSAVAKTGDAFIFALTCSSIGLKYNKQAIPETIKDDKVMKKSKKYYTTFMSTCKKIF